MQNYRQHEDAVFEGQKFYFAPGGLDPRQAQPSQPWLEVAPERDEMGTPGLQVVPQEEQKYATGGLHENVAPYRTAGAAHADELTSQGIQAVPIQNLPQIPPGQLQSENFYSQQPYQSQNETQFQWEAPAPNPYYGQSVQASSLEVVSYPSHQTSIQDMQQLSSWNPENYPLNARPPLSSDPSWAKDESHMAAAGEAKRKKWMLWIIGGVVLTMVIVGAVVGGVLGSKAGKSDSNTSSDSAPETIRAYSRIAVTGYRLDSRDDYAMRIFFQDPQQQLRFISKESTSDNWTDSTTLDTLAYAPKKEGSIAASAYMNSGTKPILELFYEDQDGIARGQMFNFELENGSLPLKGQRSSLNDYPLQIGEGTRMSSFFPYFVSQDADNKVRWTVMYGLDSSKPENPWWVNDTDLGIEASAGSALVNLPAAQNYSDAAGVVYRSIDGKISCKLRNESAESTQGTAWTHGTLAQEIPANTSIGAFAVGRPYDSDNQVNTYILYQDNDGVIQMVWQADSSGWQGPQTFDALGGALKGTDIACLTPGAFPRAELGVSREQDMNRCFFQVDSGRVKEVWYDGSDWIDVGIVPIA
ncbi:hypothetical protein F5X99DRAFT_394188 [Biscogniauxia marginata]|nr:hypothetical protein F5X99DRAFT_394188 [Biscogniauxia marginata]